ncbi:TPA: helix-turn-helix transcriptional regulator [Neisseria meningitidis]
MSYTERALRVKEVAEKLGVSENFVWAKTDRGNIRHDPTFPRPFKLSGNATAWLESEIDTWILEKSRVRI